MTEIARWYVEKNLEKNMTVAAIFKDGKKKSFLTHGLPGSTERTMQLSGFSEAEKFLYFNEIETTDLLDKALN